MAKTTTPLLSLVLLDPDGADSVLPDLQANFTKLDSAAGTYVFSQPIAASTWTISHNLNRYPAVTVVDGFGNALWADISYPNANTVIVTGSAAFSGTAYLK